MGMGRQIFQAYKKGHLANTEACELCEVMEGVFSQARGQRKELTDDLERRLFNGLTLSENVYIREKAKAEPVERVKVKFKSLFTRGVAAIWDGQNMPGYKSSIKDVIVNLGILALSCYDRNDPLLPAREHQRMCRLAAALENDSQKCWENIVEFRSQQGKKKGLAFHAVTVQFVLSFGNYFRTSKRARYALKFFGYNEKVETAKLQARYAGRPEGEALNEQLGHPCPA